MLPSAPYSPQYSCRWSLIRKRFPEKTELEINLSVALESIYEGREFGKKKKKGNMSAMSAFVKEK